MQLVLGRPHSQRDLALRWLLPTLLCALLLTLGIYHSRGNHLANTNPQAQHRHGSEMAMSGVAAEGAHGSPSTQPSNHCADAGLCQTHFCCAALPILLRAPWTLAVQHFGSIDVIAPTYWLITATPPPRMN